MNKTIIFKKGKNQYYNQLIHKPQTSETKEYYNIRDDESQKTHQLIIEYTQEGIKLSCDCTFKSLQIDKPTLCSHMITLLLKKCGEVKIK
jgi:hypothetical protein